MEFTAHNILLDNGEKTMKKDYVLLSESALWKSIEKTLNNFLVLDPGQDKSKLRVVDLGCLEGGYAVQFARMGFDTLGIEVRKENIDKCNYAKSHLNLPNLQFAQDDVRNMAKYGKFDVTLCYGLLYHLDDPINFINIISKCTTKMLFLHTHYAPEHDFRYLFGRRINKYIINPIQKRVPFLDTTKNYKLSKIIENEGARGRWYFEWHKNEKKENIEKGLWASYNNSRAFWLCKKDLTTALHKAGFDSVFEQFDFTGDSAAADNQIDYLSRSMFVAIKH